MFIENIHAENFRNITQIDLNFNKNINIIYGDNGQGKTNILELIHYLSLTKSFRTNKDSPLLNINNSFFYISANVKKSEDKKLIEIGCDIEKKKLKINGVEKKKSIDFIGNLNTVSFTPEDLTLIKGSPSERRKYLDILLCQLDRIYYLNLSKYKKNIQNKNKLLKTKPFGYEQLITSYNYILSESAEYIWKKRIEALTEISKLSTEFIRNIFNENFNVDLSYSSILDIHLNASTKEDFFNFLEQNKSKEIRKSVSIYGPHKDDIRIESNGLDCKLYSSQGQQRLIAISMKLGQINYIYKIKNEKPILLLDDVFSEIDLGKINKLLKYLEEISIQTFITTTYNDSINENYSYFQIIDGNLK